MAPGRGKQRNSGTGEEDADRDEPARELDERDLDEGGALKPIPELMRRAIGLGLASFFSTEEAVRKAFGDTVPKDWTDFLVDTSERTRSEFLQRLSHEIGRVLDNVDIGDVLQEMLEGRTLEVKAEFRLSGRETEATTAVTFVESKAAGRSKATPDHAQDDGGED